MSRRRGQTLALAVLAVLIISAVVLSTSSMFMSQTRNVQRIALDKSAFYIAEAGFNFASGKLLQTGPSLKGRWYRTETGELWGTLQRAFGDGTMDVFVSDVYNRFQELSHVHVVSRGRVAAGSGPSRTVIVHGSVRLAKTSTGKPVVTVLHQGTIDADELVHYHDGNCELYKGDVNKTIKYHGLEVNATEYERLRFEIIEALRNGGLDAIDFGDPKAASTFIALLERHRELVRLIKIARDYNDLNRDGEISSLLSLIGSLQVSMNNLLSALTSLQDDGPELTTERTELILNTLSQSQRELLIVKILLDRLAALPAGVTLKMDDKRLTPAAAAVNAARALYESITAETCKLTSLEGIIRNLIGARKILDRVNVLNRFQVVLSRITDVAYPGRPGAPAPCRPAGSPRTRPG